MPLVDVRFLETQLQGEIKFICPCKAAYKSHLWAYVASCYLCDTMAEENNPSGIIWPVYDVSSCVF